MGTRYLIKGHTLQSFLWVSGFLGKEEGAPAGPGCPLGLFGGVWKAGAGGWRGGWDTAVHSDAQSPAWDKWGSRKRGDLLARPDKERDMWGHPALSPRGNTLSLGVSPGDWLAEGPPPRPIPSAHEPGWPGSRLWALL